MSKQEVRLAGRVELHGPDGFSKIGVQIGGKRTLDIETEKIPPDLRGLGSTVLVTFKQGNQAFESKGGDVRYHYEDVVISALPENPQLGWFPSDDK